MGLKRSLCRKNSFSDLGRMSDAIVVVGSPASKLMSFNKLGKIIVSHMPEFKLTLFVQFKRPQTVMGFDNFNPSSRYDAIAIIWIFSEPFSLR
ncbi:hypothetical protein [Rhizobium leguminosarum]|uniref:hypothetical protein n=1 Tax=Rhizobium leguminosarum TaxID=384 RepID=UPI001C924F36|nr:hypothetical protein [Rhizobium leguminosarum]MBY3003818.1 hypothetical protein [Rhizobium leguminosarum]